MCSPMYRQQLPPYFNLARNNTTFAHNNNFGAPNDYFAGVPPTKKQRTSSRPLLLSAMTPFREPFQPLYFPPSRQQLPPSFNVAPNNTPFVQNTVMEIFGFTPFGIYCRVCKDGVHVGPSEQAIFLHLQSKHHGVFTREAARAFKAVADKEVEKLSRHANLALYLGDNSDGFVCRCEASFRDKKALVRHCKDANSCSFDVREARPELLFKTVCGRTVSQATLNRLSAYSSPTAGLSNFARTQAALGKYIRSDEQVGTYTALFHPLVESSGVNFDRDLNASVNWWSEPPGDEELVLQQILKAAEQ
jgi:hypothetical protein